MRTSYTFALNNIGFSLGDPFIKNEEANQETFVSVGSSFYYMDVHKFSDTMGIDNVASRGHRNGFGFESQNEKILELLGVFPPLDPNAGIGTWANGATSYSWDITGAPSSQHYAMNGTDRTGITSSTNDPSIYVVKGDTITFDNQLNGHPFYIKDTQSSSGTNNAYNVGVTNQGATSGNIIWDTTNVGVGTYYYQCSSHASMQGTIYVLASANSDTHHVGYKTIKNNLENVTKAMLIAILDNYGKRSTSVGVGTTAAKKSIFFNAISTPKTRSTSIAPWNGWNDPVGVCTPTSISRTNNVAIVTTTPAHGMSTSYDDWGISMNLNTGISTSFNTSKVTYPNGVPIKIVDANTFSYQNVGINTTTTSVTGIASVHIGWGGTSINLRMAIS